MLAATAATAWQTTLPSAAQSLQQMLSLSTTIETMQVEVKATNFI